MFPSVVKYLEQRLEKIKILIDNSEPYLDVPSVKTSVEIWQIMAAEFSQAIASLKLFQPDKEQEKAGEE